MTDEQIEMLRRLIQDEIENSGIDGMEHGVWGWKEKALDVGWKKFQESFTNNGYEVVEYQPTSQTPEQVADGLKEAFREAVKQGVVSSVDKPETLYDVCMTWWGRVFDNNDDMETCIDDLVDNIDYWLPKEQFANSQNAYVECTVEGYNDCLNKIKGKLR